MKRLLRKGLEMILLMVERIMTNLGGDGDDNFAAEVEMILSMVEIIQQLVDREVVLL